MRKCRKCSIDLVLNENWLESMVKHQNYICSPCRTKHSKSYYKNNKERLDKQQSTYYQEVVKTDPIKYKQKRQNGVNAYKRKIDNTSKSKIKEGSKGDDWIYYECIFRHKKLGFTFFKFGITSHNAKIRYEKYTQYNLYVIKEVTGDKEYCKAMEIQKKLDASLELFIFPKGIKFDGFTECRKIK